MRTARPHAVLLLMLLLATPAFAQGPGRGGRPDPPFMKELFPPELVMQNQAQIGLRPEQRKAITGAIQELQAKVIELQWELSEAQKQLHDLLRAPRVDADAALAHADRVMQTELCVKRLHLGLLIRIKNALDPEQQAQLRSRRNAF